MSRWRDIKQGKEQAHLDQTPSSLPIEPCASISSRIKAFFLDGFLITTPVFYLVIYFVMGSGEAFSQNKGNGWLIILGVDLLIIVLFWLKSGQTPGLKAYDLKLVQTQSKKKINFLQGLSRYFLTLLSIISIALMFLPFLRKDKRTFQDIFSNSIVIEE